MCLSVFFILFVLFMAYRMLNLQLHFMSYFNTQESPYALDNTIEGLENKSTGVGLRTTDGFASNSEMYAAQIKNLANRLKDKINVTNYRPQLEDMVYALDEYVGYKMIETACTSVSGGTGSGGADSGEFIAKMNTLNTLHDAKASLTSMMKIIDSAN